MGGIDRKPPRRHAIALPFCLGPEITCALKYGKLVHHPGGIDLSMKPDPGEAWACAFRWPAYFRAIGEKTGIVFELPRVAAIHQEDLHRSAVNVASAKELSGKAKIVAAPECQVFLEPDRAV